MTVVLPLVQQYQYQWHVSTRTGIDKCNKSDDRFCDISSRKLFKLCFYTSLFLRNKLAHFSHKRGRRERRRRRRRTKRYHVFYYHKKRETPWDPFYFTSSGWLLYIDLMRFKILKVGKELEKGLSTLYKINSKSKGLWTVISLWSFVISTHRSIPIKSTIWLLYLRPKDEGNGCPN